MKQNMRMKLEAERAKRLGNGMRVVVTKDDGSTVETKTLSDPFLMGGHSWMIMLDGFTGGWSVMRVEPLP